MGPLALARRGVRRIVALAIGGALIAGAIGVVPAAAAPATAPGVARPVSAAVSVDTATMISWDVGGGEVPFRTVRLNAHRNAQKTRWTKQTVRFSMYDPNESGIHHARIFQETCDDESPHHLIEMAVRADAAGPLARTVTLTSAQRAIMSRLSHEYPAVSITVQPDDPWTGVGYPCGQTWDVG